MSGSSVNVLMIVLQEDRYSPVLSADIAVRGKSRYDTAFKYELIIYALLTLDHFTS